MLIELAKILRRGLLLPPQPVQHAAIAGLIYASKLSVEFKHALRKQLL